MQNPPRYCLWFVFPALVCIPFLGLSAAEEVNPEIEKLGASVLLHVGFDQQSTDADLAAAEGKDMAQQLGERRFTKGVYGKGFVPEGAAIPQYRMKNSGMIFGRPGAAFLWVSAQGWDRGQPEDYVFFLRMNARNGQVMMAKSNQQGRTDQLYVFAKSGEDQRGNSISAGNTSEWQDEDWHLLALNWGSDWIALSVDGKEFVQLAVPELEGFGEVDLVLLGSGQSPHRNVAYDEFTVVDRTLSNEEVAAIFAAGSTASQQ